MRILQIIIVITFLLTLISCGGTNNIKNTEFPSVEIENKSFILFPEDSDTFFWPIFHSENKELEKLLNDSLSMKRIMGLSLEEIKKEKEEVDYPTGYVTSGYSVNFNEGFILDIEFYYVSIGAHFYYGGEHYKYDLKTGQELEINDIIDESYFTQLVNNCQSDIAEQVDQIIVDAKSEGEDISPYYEDIEFNTDDLYNFTLTPQGISFIIDVNLPPVIRYFEQDLGCYFSFKDYAYIAREDGLLAEYITNNKDKINQKSLADSDKEEFGKTITVTDRNELYSAVNEAREGSRILIDNDIEASTAFQIRGKKNLTIIGNMSVNAKLYTRNPEEVILEIIDCENITIKSLVMRHITGITTCVSGVIIISNSKNVTISECDISGCGAWGITVYENCENINIKNNKIYDCSYAGIDISSKNSSITGNTFYRNGNGDNDHYIDEEFKESISVNNNKYLGWDNDLLMREVNEYIGSATPVEVEISNYMGNGKAKAYYKNEELVYMEVEWNEIDIFSSKFYFARDYLQVVIADLEYGETDAPDGDYEIETEKVQIEAMFEGWDIKYALLSSTMKEDEKITEYEKLKKYRDGFTSYTESWHKIIRDETTFSEVFKDMPIPYELF